MFNILLTLLVIVAFMMVGLILVQKSEGSGLSGSSASNLMGGAMTGAGAGNFLTKLTAWLAVIFFSICLALAIIVSRADLTGHESELRREIIAAEEIMPFYVPEN